MSFPQRFLLSRPTPGSPASYGLLTSPPFTPSPQLLLTHRDHDDTEAAPTLAHEGRPGTGRLPALEAAPDPCCNAAAPRQVALQARLSPQAADSRGCISAACSSRPRSPEGVFGSVNWKYKALSSSSQVPSASGPCPKTVWTVPFSY